MALLVLAFIAGVLTVVAPCILPLLPVIVGGSVVDDTGRESRFEWLRPLVITASLAGSVIVFTLIIKATTALLGVSAMVWQSISGGVVLLVGANFIWPLMWEHLAAKAGWFSKAGRALGVANKSHGLGGALLIGAALGPVFNSCSPTYALIVATVLPASFAAGLLYLAAYAFGLAAMLLLIAFAGQVVVTRLGWLSNPRGWFKRLIGIVFMLVGAAVIFGFDKTIQAFVLEQGWYDPVSNLEYLLAR